MCMKVIHWNPLHYSLTRIFRIFGLVVCLVLFLPMVSQSQSCLPDGITFTTQSKIDSFPINYPGCSEIEGSVTIYGDDISNLDELTLLTSIGHYLKIYNTSSLGNLHGLNHVVSIGGDLIIEENDLLNNLSGLIGLVHIDESLIIKENQSLTSLFGLNNLTTIGEDLSIGIGSYSWTGNPLLKNLSGLQSLTSIGNTLRVMWNHGLEDLSGIENLSYVENIKVSSNDSLLSLNGLQGVTNVNGFVMINWSEALNSLNGLNNLTTAGKVILYRLKNLDDLSGFDRLTTVANDLTIIENFSISSIASFDSLTYIGGKLTIEDNNDLIDLSGFHNLTEIGGGLEIYGNNNLSSISSLSSLTSIGGDLNIREGDLTSLVGLSGVESIAGDLTIVVSSITSLSGIENIDPSSIENLRISGANSLTDCAFPNICEYLENPNGIVDIYHNGYPCNSPVQIANECGITLPCLPYGNYYFYYQYEIDNFQNDFPGCTDLKGSVILRGGSGGAGDYTNLDGLSVITSIDSIFSIHGAHLLTSLSGIDNIDGTSFSDLGISDCPLLSECEVQSICDYLANPNGITIIEDNADGCNSPEEVLDSCIANSVHINEQLIEDIVMFYPNPCTRELNISAEGYIIDEISIYNNLGQRIIHKEKADNTIDVSWLPQGLYIVEVVWEGLRVREKLIVQ